MRTIMSWIKNAMDKICKPVEVTMETFQSETQRENRV